MLKQYRVIQWATGNIGTRSLRTVIQHPRMRLVGLYVSSRDKVGKDAGALCGLAPVGIAATSSVDEIVGLEADCVLYMRQGIDFDQICRLLASGKNVVTTRGEFHHPRSMDAALRRRVEEACMSGNTSIYSTGSSPGFVTEALSLPLLSLERRLECLTIDEFANLSRRDSPDMIFNIMGYGAQPGVFDQRKLDYVHHDFAGTLSQIADAIGQPFDTTEVKGEMAGARHRTQIAAGTIEKGTVAALRITVTGVRSGKPLLRFRANWYCTEEVEADWQLEETGWRVRVEGDTPLDVRIRFPVPLEDYALVMPGLTAHRAVNSVIAVCEAQPGIRTTVDLPQVIAVF